MNELSLSSWILAADSPVLRRPLRDARLRQADFDERYDFRTVFYDCFWSADGESVMLIGPPLMNLAAELKPRFFAMPSGEELLPDQIPRTFISELRIATPPAMQGLRVESAAGSVTLVPQPNMSAMFAGRRVLITLSQNNEWEWIRDWILFHQRVHGCDAVLLYDNNSTRYDAGDLGAYLASLPGITAQVLRWPFRYGPFDGRLPLTYDLWEGHFCQFGMLEHARYRFLQEARSFLNLDIDELVMCPDGESICALTEDSAKGYIKFGGRWVEPYRSSRSEASAMPLHRDYWHSATGRTQGCETKYAAVPSRIPAINQFGIHEVFCYPEGLRPDGVELRHFKALNTNWTVDRPGELKQRTQAGSEPEGLAADEGLRAVLAKTFAGTEAGLGHVHPAAAPAARITALNLADAKDGVIQYQEARYRLHQGDWMGAIRALHRSIRLEPQFGPARLLLARLLRAAGRPLAAKRALTRGIALIPAWAPLRLALAEILAADGKAAAALAEIDEAIRLDPQNGDQHLIRCRLLRTEGRHAEALAAAMAGQALHADSALAMARITAAFERPFEARFPDPMDITARSEVIQCLVDLKETEAAAAQSLALLALHPNHRKSHESRYLALALQGEAEAAASHLATAIRLAQRDAAELPPQTLGRLMEREWFEYRLFDLCHLLDMAGRTDEAIAALREALLHYPESHATAHWLINLLRRTGDKAQLSAVLAEVLQRFPRDLDLFYERGQLLEQAGDRDGAIAVYRRALGLGTRQAWLKSHLAQLLTERAGAGDLPAAEVLLHEAIAQEPGLALNHYRLGEVLARSDRRQESLAAFRQAASLAPEEAWLWSHFGAQLVESGELDEAEPVLAQALKLNDRDMLTHHRIARLHEERGDVATALAHDAAAIALGDTPAWLWQHYAQLLSRAGRMEEAEQARQKATADA